MNRSTFQDIAARSAVVRLSPINWITPTHRLFAAAILIMSGGGLGCAPKDIKVSNRGGGFTASGGTTDASFPDRSSEYSRAMLIDLADAARDLEMAIEAVRVSENDAVPLDANLGADVGAVDESRSISGLKVSQLVTPACEVTTKASSPKGTLKLETDVQNCREKGETFEGSRFGKRVMFATVLKESANDQAFPTFIRVEAKGVEAILKPNVNPKDTLRVKTYRFLEAEYLATEEMTRVYRVSLESTSHYSLDLKSFSDAGTIRSTLTGLMTYDLTTRTMSGYTGVEPSDRMGVKVDSAREGRSGGRVVRQEFFGSATAVNLGLNLSDCQLPMGVLKTRFTVKPLSGDKKYLIDSVGSFESLRDELVFVEPAAADGTQKTVRRIQAKLCSSENALTMTEFFAGLLY